MNPKEKVQVGTNPRDHEYRIVIDSDIPNCAPLGRWLWVSIQRFDHIDDEWQNHSGTVDIDWGDGSSSSYNYPYSSAIRHDYGQIGFYEVAITATYTNIATGQTEQLEESINHNLRQSCSEEGKQKLVWVEDFPYALHAKIWFDTGAEVGAFTHSWRWSYNQDKWRKSRARVEVWLDVLFVDVYCDYLDHDNGFNDCSNCRRRQLTRRCPSPFAPPCRINMDEGATTWHRVNTGTALMETSLSLLCN